MGISMVAWTKDVMHLHLKNFFFFFFLFYYLFSIFFFKEALIQVVAHLKPVSTSINNNLSETITILLNMYLTAVTFLLYGKDMFCCLNS